MWTNNQSGALENHLNGSGGQNFANSSSSLSSYATFNDSESSPILEQRDPKSSTKLWLSKTGLNCPVCQHDFCFSLLLCTNGQEQNGLAENSMKLVRELHSRLHGVSLECTVLRSELEVLYKAFNSKCQAVKILTNNTFQSADENDQKQNTVYASTVELEKEINKLKIDLELSKGALLSQHQSSKAKVQQLKNENENLRRQLENLQFKTGQLLEENMHLLQKNTMLVCSPTYQERVEKPPEITNPDKSTKFYLNKNSLEKLADQDVPLTSEGILYVLENRIKSQFHDKRTSLPEMKTNLKDDSISQNGFQLFFSRLRSSKLDKTLNAQQQQERSHKSFYIDKDSQCDFNSLIHQSSGIREISIPLKCLCVSDSDEACECARTTVNVQRQLLHYKCQLSEMTKRIKQLELSEDAHRHALKEQYERNKHMSVQLTGILPYTSEELLNSPNYVLSSHCSSTVRNSFGKSNSRKNNSIVSQTLSTTESFHNLLLWFHKILKATSTSLRSLSSFDNQLTFDQDKNSYSVMESIHSKSKSPTYIRKFTGNSMSESLTLHNESSRCQYEKDASVDGINKLRDISNKEQINLATKRKISLKGVKSTFNSMLSQSDDLTISDKLITLDNHITGINDESIVQNQTVYSRKISRSSSIHAKQLKSRCRSMEHVSSPKFSEEENMNIMLLHQLLLQVNCF
ncbi:unnamed protein product [Schistosoma rodhaini]|uniref:Uncharacterized protein n=1 Tax=Schistosoma rodhaini TaxID=6188 RepID=A0AA85F8K4_9TREM|nr:unnamed protein product [Schistosoma rodhaini]